MHAGVDLPIAKGQDNQLKKFFFLNLSSRKLGDTKIHKHKYVTMCSKLHHKYPVKFSNNSVPFFLARMPLLAWQCHDLLGGCFT